MVPRTFSGYLCARYSTTISLHLLKMCQDLFLLPDFTVSFQYFVGHLMLPAPFAANNLHLTLGYPHPNYTRKNRFFLKSMFFSSITYYSCRDPCNNSICRHIRIHNCASANNRMRRYCNTTFYKYMRANPDIILYFSMNF